MSNVYDEYEEMVIWDDSWWDRKATVDTFSSYCQAVLKSGADFTGTPSNIVTGAVLQFDGRWSSTPNSDLPSVGDDFDYVQELDKIVSVTEAATGLFLIVGADAVGNQIWEGQTVTPAVTRDLRNIEVKFGAIAVAPASVYIEIWTAPGGALLAQSNAINSVDIIQNDWNLFKLRSAITLTGAVQYFVVVRTSAASALNNNYQIEYSNANPYAGGTRWQKTGPAWPPPFAWAQQVGDDLLMRLFAPDGTEITWGTEFTNPYTRLQGTEIDTTYGEGMWIGTDQAAAATQRIVLLNDHLCFGRYSGDNAFIMKFKCPPPEDVIGISGYHWRFYFMCQNCQTLVDFNANGAGYYIKFTGLQVELRYFDNALAADILLGNFGLAATPYNTDMVLCVVTRHDSLAVPADRIDVYVDPSGAAPPHAPIITVNRGGLPAAQRYYYGTCLFAAEGLIAAANELHGAEINHFNIYGRVLDYDLAAIVSSSRFFWAPETSFAIPEEWTENETIYHEYKGWPDSALTVFEPRLEVRNKLDLEAWNSRMYAGPPEYLYCHRDVNVTNLKPIVILQIPRLVLNGVPFSLNLVNSFDPEEGHLWFDILMGDDSMTKVIDTKYQHPAAEHTYYSVSNPVDGGINTGLGYLVKAIAKDESGLISDEVQARVWVTPDFRTTEYTHTPLAPFETQEEERPSSGYGRNNAPFFGQDVITNTFAGSRTWNISGKHVVVGADKFGKTPDELAAMVLYEHLLFDIMQKYGVVFRLTLGDGQIIRGAIQDYDAEPTVNPQFIEYTMRFIEVQKPWKSIGQDMII